MAQRRSSNRVGAGEGAVEKRRGIKPQRGAHISVLTLFVAVAVGAWLGLVLQPRWSHAVVSRAQQRAIRNRRTYDGRRGPWGQLEYSRIAISMPDEYVPDEPPGRPIRWWFPGFTRERVESLFRDAGLTSEQLGLLGQGKWESSSQGVVLDPPFPLVADLSPTSRARIYEALAVSPRNEAQHSPEVVHPEFLEERLESSGLDDQTIAMFRKLLYPHGSQMLFSDSQVVLPTLQRSRDRKLFEQMVHRKMTVLVQLVVDETSNIDEMVAYWDFPGRPKGLRTLFESLSRVPGGGELDIAHLLPPFARMHLYTFPDPSTGQPAPRHDCVWTSLNFFNDQPDDRLSDPEYTHKVIAQDYVRVEAPKFGDIAVLLGPNKQSVHAAVYLADDLVFTKNGFSATQPWMLMPLADVVTFYSIASPTPLELGYFRRKG